MEEMLEKVPFNLEEFIAGRAGVDWKLRLQVMYRFTAKDGIINFEYEDGLIDEASVETLQEKFGMLSRHGAIAKQYMPNQSWLYKEKDATDWNIHFEWKNPLFKESCEYKLHPYSDLIYQFIHGGIGIEMSCEGKEWREVKVPSWSIDCQYREKTSDVAVELVICRNAKTNVLAPFYLKDREPAPVGYYVHYRTGKIETVPNY